MTKAELIAEISNRTGIEKTIVLATVEEFARSVKKSLIGGKNVYIRGFGSFIVKKRKKKIGRNITKNTSIVIPEHFTPVFKPSKIFIRDVKKNVKK